MNVLVFWSAPSLVQETQIAPPELAFASWPPFEQILGSAAPSCPAAHAKKGRTAQAFATQGGTRREMRMDNRARRR